MSATAKDPAPSHAQNRRRAAARASRYPAADAFECATGRALGHLTDVLRCVARGRLHGAFVAERNRRVAVKDMRHHAGNLRRGL